MANTYHKIHIHAIFAVKFRKGLIQPEWESRLHAVIGNLIKDSGGKPIIINGTEDHIHCFFHVKPTATLSEMMKTVKAKSSKWINNNDLLNQRFEWQRGYGCFSYGQSQKNTLYHYISNQKERHKKMSFKEEYEKLLRLFEIEYYERYLFKNPE